jgi:hypothetical protein
MRQIKILIKKDATVQTEVNGVKGEKCTDLTKKLVDRLGDKVKEEQTGEYFEVDETTTDFLEQSN